MNKKTTKSQLLLDAGLEIFVEKGFEKATIDDIVLKAGCGKGTFYRYFNNKEDLFETLDQNFLKQMGDALKKNCSDSMAPREYLLTSIKTFIEVFSKNDKIGLVRFERDFRLTVEERKRSSEKILKNLSFIGAYFEKARASGKIRNHNPEAILITLIGTAHFFLFREFKLGIPCSQSEIENATDVIYYGVEPE